MGKISVSLIALVAILAALGDAMALGENIVASKAYVDTKQNEIAARATKIHQNDVSFAPSVVTNGVTAGDVGQMAILTGARKTADDREWDDYDSDNIIPTLGAVGDEFDKQLRRKQDRLPANNSTTYPNGSVVTYGSADGEPGAVGIANAATHNPSTGALTNGTSIASIAAVDTKQDKIPAKATKINASDTTFAPSVVTNGATAGDVGQMAILTQAKKTADGDLYLDDYTNNDSLIPTAAAVATEIDNLWASKQDQIPAKATKIDESDTSFSPSVVTNGTTAGDVGQMAILTQARKTADGVSLEEYTNYDSLIPTAAAVATEIGDLWDGKQNKIIANNSTTFPNGSVVTYGATAGVPGQVAIANAATHNPSTGALTNGTSIASIAAVDTKQDKIVASGWQDEDNTTIPGVVLSSNADGTVNLRMLLDKTNLITSGSISDLVAEGYDDFSGAGSSIAYDIHDESVSAADVNSAVPTTTMTVAIANAAADAAVSNKQDKIAANNSTTYPYGSVVTYGATAGNPGEMGIMTADSNSGESWEAWSEDETNLPTIGAVADMIQGSMANAATHNEQTGALTNGTDIASIAAVDAKQDKIAANNSTTYPNGSVVTYGATAGNPGQVAIANAPTFDANGGLTNGTSIPSMKAVANQLTYFGTSDTAASTKTKVVQIPELTELIEGTIVVVMPTITSTAGSGSLQVNDASGVSLGSYPIRYRGAALTTTTDAYVWTENAPSMFLLHDNTWVFIGRGYDANTNTTYSAMSVAEGTEGTATNSRTMRADYLKQIIQGTALTGLDTTSATTVAATDSVLGGIGKLQAQITNVSGNLPTGTSGSVVTYDGLDANNVQQYSENAIASAPVYENGTLSNPNSLATISAVETKQNKIAANNATTYPNGSVVTYGATAGVPGQVAIANAPAYNQSTGALTNGTDIASVAAVNTAVNAAKPVCVGWETGHENDDAYCYFWSVPE